MATLKFNNICKTYDNNFKAIENFNLELKDKEFVVLVGPSGCGKSTILRIIAGLEDITSGKLFIDDVCVNDVSPKDRDIAMVFQNYALYPHKNVYDNLAFGMKIRKVDKNTIDEKVKKVSKILDLGDLLDRKPGQLSGGQRQRVALGRAIVRNPKVFLMDEPLSNLDAKLRVQMRAEIVKLQKDLQTTMIYVTHDQTEAMTMGDRIVIMKDGVIQQIGTPDEIYKHPVNIFVAEFIGSPSINILEAEDFYIASGEKIPSNYCVGLRPENLRIVEGDDYVITVIENLGSEKFVHVEREDIKLTIKYSGETEYLLGDRISLRIKNDTILNYFDKNTGESVSI